MNYFFHIASWGWKLFFSKKKKQRNKLKKTVNQWDRWDRNLATCFLKCPRNFLAMNADTRKIISQYWKKQGRDKWNSLS